MQHRRLTAVSLALIVGSGCTIAYAAAPTVTGHVELGWREVSVDGSIAKYVEDINLDDGPRLVSAAVTMRPQDPQGELPDLVDIELVNLGGDPFESMRLEVRKFGAYRFKAHRQRSEYRYDDVIVLPQDASITGSTGGDFHRFDFERIRDDVALDMQLSERAALTVGFERSTRRGESTTTLDIQRDEFELDRPIDESTDTLRAEFRYRWDKVTLSLEERVSNFESRTELFLPGFSLGENPTDLSTLDFFVLDQPYDYRSFEHTVRLHGRPADRVHWQFAGTIANLDMDIDASERSQGTDFVGLPFTTDLAGAGRIGRDTAIWDLAGGYVLSDRVELTAGIQRRELDQSGGFEFGASEGGQSKWRMATTGFDVGVVVSASSTLAFSLGFNRENRNVDVGEFPASGALTGRDTDTRSKGVFATLDYRPNKRLSVNASIDDNDVDDPFTLASPTRSKSYRLRGQYRFDNGFVASVSHRKRDLDNGNTRWSLTTQESQAQLTYVSTTLTASLGATLVDISRSFERLVTGGMREDLFAVAYGADTLYVDASARWSVGGRWTIGGTWRMYNNNGSFDVRRDDALGFVEAALGERYTLRTTYRNVDYREGRIEDYDADVVEIALRFSL